jgi:hypothetical protein
MHSAAEVAQAFRLAYGSALTDIDRYQRSLARIAQLLSAGEGVRARIEAVLLAVPEIELEGMAKLAEAAELRKDNPDWRSEPRDPAGIPEGGEWTSAGAEEAEDANVQPAAAQTSDVQGRKERFVDTHLAEAQRGADELGVPVENILGLSALESTWGQHRFAAQGNNYFGIHYPAPFANGYMLAKGDPKTFAAALQNSGRFGIDPDTGARVPAYVGDVAGTIRGIRLIVARRKI